MHQKHPPANVASAATGFGAELGAFPAATAAIPAAAIAESNQVLVSTFTPLPRAAGRSARASYSIASPGVSVPHAPARRVLVSARRQAHDSRQAGAPPGGGPAPPPPRPHGRGGHRPRPRRVP